MDTKRGKTAARDTAITTTGAVALLALLALALPGQASAGDDFERGFKRELGAIAAQEAVGIGRHILIGAFTGSAHRHDGRIRRHGYRSNYSAPYRRSFRSYRYGVHPYRAHRYDHRFRAHRPPVVHEYHYYGDACGH
jgi:hypothetical protein